MKFDYNFDNIKTEQVEEKKQVEGKKQTGLKIVPTCGNCKFFWNRHRSERRGYCKLNSSCKKPIDRNTPNPDWLDNKVHVTMTCDAHELRSWRRSIKRVSEWVGKNFDNRGNLIK